MTPRKILIAVIGTLGSAMIFLSGCAQVEEPKVTQVQNQTLSESAALKQAKEREAKYGNLRVLKRKVAIARFSNETNYGRSFLIDDSFDPIGKQALDILSTTLQQTGKFVLLERADLDKINEELSLSDSAQLKNMADYLILGSITGFGRRTEGESGIFSRTKKQVAYSTVSIRLVDVRSGQVIYADEGSGEASSEVGTTLGLGTKAGYDSSLNDRAIDAAINNLANNIIENLLEKPWRSYILAEDNGNYIIGGGPEQGLRVGDRFVVIKQGRMIENPQTGVSVALPGEEVATIEVLAFAGDGPLTELAITKVVEGEVAAETDFSSHIVEEKQLTQAYRE